jgi:FkbM family methyltransferase
MGLRRILKNLFNNGKHTLPFLNESYSQEGEDLLLARIFENQMDGFFVDVGALHPQRFSNTFKFYKLGWRGINIDAMPQSMIEFNHVRPEDINLETPVSDKKQVLSYHIFNEPALNTFSKEMAEERSKKEIYNVQQVVDIETRTLTDILDEYLPEGRAIDFLTIDVEGLDFQVLKSNNWEKYQPKMILLENELELHEMIGSSIDLFMQEKNYQLYAKTVKTFFYKNKNFSI